MDLLARLYYTTFRSRIREIWMIPMTWLRSMGAGPLHLEMLEIRWLSHRYLFHRTQVRISSPGWTYLGEQAREISKNSWCRPLPIMIQVSIRQSTSGPRFRMIPAYQTILKGGIWVGSTRKLKCPEQTGSLEILPPYHGFLLPTHQPTVGAPIC